MSDLTVLPTPRSNGGDVSGERESYRYRPEADSFDLLAAWEALLLALRFRWRLIAAVTIGTVSLLMAYAFIWPPVYQADVVLAANPEDDTGRDSFYDQWAVFRQNALQDEVLLFTSKPVLSEVIEEKDLTYDDVYHPPVRYAFYLWSESWLGRNYQRLKKILFPPPESPYTPTEEEIDFARTLKDFQAGVSMAGVQDSNLGMLSVRGPSPRVAEIANAVAETYLRQRRETFAAEAEAAYLALEEETQRAYDELRAVEAEMERFFTDNEMLLMFEKDKVEISQFLAREQELADSERLIAKLKEQIAAIDAMMEDEEREIVSSRTYQADPVYASYESQLGQLEVTRESLLQRYRPDSPEVQDVENQMEILRQAMAGRAAERVQARAVVRNDRYEDLRTQRSTLYASLQGELAARDALARDLAERRADIERIPGKMKLNHELGRNHSALEKKYMLLRDKMMVAAVTRATAKSAPSSIRIVEPAEVPFKPVAPNKKLLLAGGLGAGLVFGTGLALLLQYFHRGVTRESLRTGAVDLPVFATLPLAGAGASGR